MPEIIVKYKNKRTLEALRDFAKYFDYEISSLPGSQETETTETILNGVTIIPADSSIDATGLTKIFSGKNIDARELRNKVWQRRK